MAFEDCYPVTLDVCTDCVYHIEYGTGACCHEPRHGDPRPYEVLRRLPPVDPMEDRPCAVGLRLERRHRDVVAFTMGCHADNRDADDADHDCTDGGFTHSACEGCGAGGGHREHVTAWVKLDPRPVRTLVRNGWHVEIRAIARSGTFYAVAERDGDTRCLIHGMPYGGANRWQAVAEFLRKLADA